MQTGIADRVPTSACVAKHQMLLRRENALETQYPDVGKHCDAATLGACYLSGME